MKLNIEKHYDVIVVGGGLAALQAAIYSSKAGSKVLLTTSHLFGGSSFYPNTWGLGLVSADGESDIANFKQSILKVGSNINNEILLDKLLNDELKIIEDFKDLKIPLLEAKDKDQKDFIPCFDNKRRAWYGLESKPIKKAYKKLLKTNQVDILEHHDLVDLIYEDKEVSGVILLSNNKLKAYSSSSVILATGGLGNLYKHSLNTSDVSGVSQYLALKYGASLINMEFQQMMLAYVNPGYKTIYNEKIYTHTRFFNEDGNLFSSKDRKYLESRSNHGPFTSRLISKEVDLKILESIKNNKSVYAKYEESLFDLKSEFVNTYFTWLEENKTFNIKDSFEVDIFFHAANGGIKIDSEASSEIANLYACGEVSGGVHGADRIGGLTTASAITFGSIAGTQAAQNKEKLNIESVEFAFKTIKNAKEIISELQNIMQDYCMVIRNEEGLNKALHRIEVINDSLEYDLNVDYKSIKDSVQLLACLTLSKVIIQAALLRDESRGSHYRSDCPSINSEYEKSIVSFLKDNKVITEWEKH